MQKQSVQPHSYVVEFDLTDHLITEQKEFLDTLVSHRGCKNLHLIQPHLIAKVYSQTLCKSSEVHGTLIEVSHWESIK